MRVPEHNRRKSLFRRLMVDLCYVVQDKEVERSYLYQPCCRKGASPIPLIDIATHRKCGGDPCKLVHDLGLADVAGVE